MMISFQYDISEIEKQFNEMKWNKQRDMMIIEIFSDPVLCFPGTVVTLTICTVLVTIWQKLTRDMFSLLSRRTHSLCISDGRSVFHSQSAFTAGFVASVLWNCNCTRLNWLLNADAKSMFGMSGPRGWEKERGRKKPFYVHTCHAEACAQIWSDGRIICLLKLFRFQCVTYRMTHTHTQTQSPLKQY